MVSKTGLTSERSITIVAQYVSQSNIVRVSKSIMQRGRTVDSFASHAFGVTVMIAPIATLTHALSAKITVIKKGVRFAQYIVQRIIVFVFD